LKLAVFSPRPPSSSGIADYVAEQLPALARHHEVVPVGPRDAPPEGALRVYHLGNSPEHGYVLRAACDVPGVAVLHEWNLHHLVLHETLERGDRAAYLREMRRAWGERGTFAGRQVARGLGGELLPSLFALNDRVLQNSLAVVGLTRYVASRATARLRGRPVLHLPHHAVVPLQPVPSREEARRALGVALDAPLVVAPGLATAHKRLEVAARAVQSLRKARPSLELVVAGGVDDGFARTGFPPPGGGVRVTGRLELPDFVRWLAAADVVLCLRFPTYGETSGALLRALAIGRPVLVTAGSPLSEELPPGVVVPVDPDRCEEAEIVVLLDRLLADERLRGRIGRLAQAWVREHHDLDATAAALATFLDDVGRREADLRAHLEARRAPEGSLAAFLGDEVRFAALELGLPGVPPEVDEVLSTLT
jgi:glycosyltransferase involved in cell wall biosynthesis